MSNPPSWDDDEDYEPAYEPAVAAPLPVPSAVSDDDEPFNAFFTVANPTGSISVTAALNGALHHVELTSAAARGTERQLADELVALGRLASEKAQSAQHAVIAELMTTMGHDRVEITGFLEREIGLPSPYTAEAHRSEVFAELYLVPGE